MKLTTIDTQTPASGAYSISVAGLDIGPEIDWPPDHLALSAWLEHLPFAFWLIKVLRPACVVELGTERGVSYAAFCQAVDQLATGSRCYAVDTWQGDDHAGHYDESVFHQLSLLNDRRYRQFSSLLRTTFAQALPAFADGEIDLLHIDGLHTYEAVSEDFRTWRPKLSNRAIVVFHDTNERRDDFGVWRVWRELTQQFPHFEFVHGHGLGVIAVGDTLPAPIRALFDAAGQDDLRIAVRTLFAARGASVQQSFDLQCARNQAEAQTATMTALRHQADAMRTEAETMRTEAAASREQAATLGEQTTMLCEQAATLKAQLAAAQADAEAERRAAAAGRADIDTLRQHHAAAIADITAENSQLVAQLAHSRHLAAAQAADANVIIELRSQLAGANDWVLALQNSTSWRVTAPLRAVKTAMTERSSGSVANLLHPLGSDRWKTWLGRLSVAPSGTIQTPAAIEPPRDRRLPPAAQIALLRLRVLLVAELTVPQCKKYRVDQKHDMIEALGFDCSVVPWQDTDKVLSLLHTHSLVIFYRVPAFANVKRMIHEADDLGLPHYFELDDLIFDLNDYAANPNLIGLDAETTKGLFQGAVLYRDALAQCRDVIASTPYLAERMQQVGGGTSVVIENALDAETLRSAESVRRRPPDGKVTIVYGSGTRTHDADFALIGNVLKRVAVENDNVEILLVGQLNPPETLLDIGDRLQRLPARPYPEYLALLATADIAVAPLIDANFNEAKSNIKFLEAAAMGVPSVCSPRSAFARAVKHGTTGFLATTQDDWYTALTALVRDPALRQRMGDHARRQVLDDYSPDAIGHRQVLPMLAGHQPPADPRLHILQVNILCKPQTFGGATVVMEEMARHLGNRADTRVSIVASAPSGWLKPYEVERGDLDGTPIFRVGIQDRPGWLAEYWDESAAEAFRHVLRLLRPDVVHFHAVQGIGAATLQVCHHEDIPFVVTLHDAWWICERQFLVTGEGKYCGQTRINMNICATCVDNIGVTVPRNLRLRQALDSADLLLTPSHHWRRFYLANRFAPDRIVVNENGIPLPASAKPNEGPPALRFGFVAGAESVKGFPLLKRTFEALDRGDWELVLVNHGLAMGVDSYQDVTWQAQGTIRTIPPYSTEARDRFYDSIDVLLFPSQWPESFGLTVREALARNKWVIVTDQGGAAEAVRPGVNGTLIPMNNEIAPFRQAIEDLLDRKPDLAGWVNPLSGHVRDFATQASELRDILASVAARAANPATSQAAD